MMSIDLKKVMLNLSNVFLCNLKRVNYNYCQSIQCKNDLENL